MDAITAIQQRVSTRSFRPEPVPRQVIVQLLDCAVRAPNHKLTEPWRFTVLTGAARDRFAELRAAHRLKRFENRSSPEAIKSADKMHRETRDTPAFIVVMVDQNPDEITCEEDYAAAVMAEANLIIAAESLGLATYLKTGGIMQDPEVIRLARVPERYRIIGIISLGYPAAAETPRKRTPAAELTDWVE